MAGRGRMRSEEKALTAFLRVACSLTIYAVMSLDVVVSNNKNKTVN